MLQDYTLLIKKLKHSATQEFLNKQNDLTAEQSQFIEHLKNNHIDLSKIQFPSYIEPFDITGIRAKDKLDPFEIIYKVPISLAISAFTAFQDEKCRQLIKKYPDIFVDVTNENSGNKNDFLTLVLFVVIKKIDKDPLWLYWFNMTPDPQSLVSCPINLLQNPNLLYLSKIYQEFTQYMIEKVDFLKMLLKENVTSEDIIWAFKYVMSRRLSISNEYKYSYLVPLVDMVNHSESMSRFCIINEEYEMSQPNFYEPLVPQSSIDSLYENQWNYRECYKLYNYIQSKQGFLTNQSTLEILDSLPQPIPENKATKKFLIKYVSDINRKILEEDKERQLWDVNNFEIDINDEDEFFKKQGYIVIDKVKPTVDDSYIQEYYNEDVEEDNVEKEDKIASNLEWFTNAQLQQIQDEVYFVVQSIQTIEKGQEILNLYSRLGNEFLLLYYGFAQPSNNYDRVIFRFQMKFNCIQDFLENIHEGIHLGFLSYQDKKQNLFEGKIELNELTSEFKLQKNKINIELIQFIRTYSKFLQTNRQYNKSELATSFQEELSVLSAYEECLCFLEKQFTIDEALINESLIQKNYSWEYRLEIYKLSKWRILNSQKKIIRNSIKILSENSVHNKQLDPNVFKQIYLGLTMKELLQVSDYLNILYNDIIYNLQ